MEDPFTTSTSLCVFVLVISGTHHTTILEEEEDDADEDNDDDVFSGVGWVKRQMATSLRQTLTINHQELHFEIMVTFIGIYTKTLTFDIGDEFEIDVGPSVNTQVTIQ